MTSPVTTPRFTVMDDADVKKVSGGFRMTVLSGDDRLLASLLITEFGAVIDLDGRELTEDDLFAVGVHLRANDAKEFTVTNLHVGSNVEHLTYTRDHAH